MQTVIYLANFRAPQIFLEIQLSFSYPLLNIEGAQNKEVIKVGCMNRTEGVESGNKFRNGQWQMIKSNFLEVAH